MAIYRPGERPWKSVGSYDFNVGSLEQPDQNEGFLDDTLTDLKLGASDIVEGTAGLVDLGRSAVGADPEHSATGWLKDQGFYDWQREQEDQYSPERKEAERAYAEAVAASESELGKAGTAAVEMALNPRVLGGRIIRSAPSMALAGVTGGVSGAAYGAAGARVGAAIGEGLISGGQSAASIVKHNEEAGNDPYRNIGYGAAVGGATGAIAHGASRFGGGIESALFNREAREAARAGIVKHMAGEAAEEAAQSVPETTLENVATDKPWEEGLGQSVAEGAMAGAGMGGAFHAVARPKFSKDGQTELVGENSGTSTTKTKAEDMAAPRPNVDKAAEGVTPIGASGYTQEDVDAYMDENGYVDTPEQPQTVAAQPAGAQPAAPKPDLNAPAQTAPQGAQPSEPAKPQFGEKEYYGIMGDAIGLDEAVPANNVKALAGMVAERPEAADIAGAFAKAKKAVGSNAKQAKILNIVKNLLMTTGSREEALAKIAERVKTDEGRTFKQNELPEVDLFAAAYEVLTNPNTDLMSFVNGRRAARDAAGEAKAKADLGAMRAQEEKKAAAQRPQMQRNPAVDAEAERERTRRIVEGSRVDETPAQPQAIPTPAPAAPAEPATPVADVPEAPKAEAPAPRQAIEVPTPKEEAKPTPQAINPKGPEAAKPVAPKQQEAALPAKAAGDRPSLKDARETARSWEKKYRELQRTRNIPPARLNEWTKAYNERNGTAFKPEELFGTKAKEAPAAKSENKPAKAFTLEDARRRVKEMGDTLRAQGREVDYFQEDDFLGQLNKKYGTNYTMGQLFPERMRRKQGSPESATPETPRTNAFSGELKRAIEAAKPKAEPKPVEAPKPEAVPAPEAEKPAPDAEKPAPATKLEKKTEKPIVKNKAGRVHVYIPEWDANGKETGNDLGKDKTWNEKQARAINAAITAVRENGGKKLPRSVVAEIARNAGNPDDPSDKGTDTKGWGAFFVDPSFDKKLKHRGRKTNKEALDEGGVLDAERKQKEISAKRVDNAVNKFMEKLKSGDITGIGELSADAAAKAIRRSISEVEPEEAGRLAAAIVRKVLGSKTSKSRKETIFRAVASVVDDLPESARNDIRAALEEAMPKAKVEDVKREIENRKAAKGTDWEPEDNGFESGNVDISKEFEAPTPTINGTNAGASPAEIAAARADGETKGGNTGVGSQDSYGDDVDARNEGGLTITNGESATRTNVAYGQSGEQAANAIKRALVEEAKQRGLIEGVPEDEQISAIRDALEENPEAKEAFESRFIELIEDTPDSVFGVETEEATGRKYLKSAMNSDSINEFYASTFEIGLELGLSRFRGALDKRIADPSQLQSKSFNRETQRSNRDLEQALEAGETKGVAESKEIVKEEPGPKSAIDGPELIEEPPVAKPEKSLAVKKPIVKSKPKIKLVEYKGNQLSEAASEYVQKNKIQVWYNRLGDFPVFSAAQIEELGKHGPSMPEVEQSTHFISRFREAFRVLGEYKISIPDGLMVFAPNPYIGTGGACIHKVPRAFHKPCADLIRGMASGKTLTVTPKEKFLVTLGEPNKEKNEYTNLFDFRAPIHEIWHAIDQAGSKELGVGIYSEKIRDLLEKENSIYLKELTRLRELGERHGKENSKQETAFFFTYPFMGSYFNPKTFKRLPLLPHEAFAELMSLYMSSGIVADIIRSEAPNTFNFIKETIDAVSSLPRPRHRQTRDARPRVPSILSQVFNGPTYPAQGNAESLSEQSSSHTDTEMGNERLAAGRAERSEPSVSEAELAGEPEVSDAGDGAGRNGDYSGNRREGDGLSRRVEVGILLPHTPTSGRSGDSVQLKNRESPSGERAELRRAERASSPDHRLSSGLSAKAARLKLRLAIINRTPKPLKPFVTQLMSLAERVTPNALGILFTKDVVALGKRVLPEMGAFYETMERTSAYRNDHQSKVADIHERYQKLSKDVQEKVNRILRDGTLNGVWFYDSGAPEMKDGFEKYAENLSTEEQSAFAALREAYNALPEDAQKVVRDVFNHGMEALAERTSILKDNVRAIYEDQIARADTQVAKDLLASERDQRIYEIESAAKQLKGPYVALKRFGKHVVVLRSGDLIEKTEFAKRVYERIKERSGGHPTAKQLLPYKKLQAEIIKMEQNSDDYIVETFDSEIEAELEAQRLKEQYPQSSVESFERSEWSSSRVPSWQQLEQVVLSARTAMNSGEEGKTKDVLGALYKAATQMYVEALKDQSARKSELRRRKVTGFNENMMDNFLEQGRSEAVYFSNLKYGTEMRRAIHDMDDAVRVKGSDRNEASKFRNELLRRYELMLKGTDSAIASGIMRTTSMWMLMTNPSFYLQNLTQPFMMSAPYMAGRYGTKAFTELAKNAVEVGKWLAKGGSVTSLQKMEGVSKELYEAIDRARDQGHIDIGITQDFGHVSASKKTGVEKAVINATDKLTDIARKVEIVNRVSTFITAYNLAKGEGMSKEDAYQYADNVIYETHGDYSAQNAPRYFRANEFAKVATQFRKFQLIQLGYMFRLVKNSFEGATKEERAVARQALKWTMGVHLATAGIKGTPLGAALMGLVAMALGDDGEDGEEYFRRVLNDKALADVLLNGLPAAAGVDLSQKVGASNMLGVLPYYTYNAADGRQAWYEFVGNAIGPAGTLGAKVAEGLRYAGVGDYWKGLEQIFPTGLANVAKAMRFGSEGITTRAGDVVVPGESFTLGELIAQGMGVTTMKVSDRTRIMGNVIRHEESLDAEADRIRQDFRKAMKDRDLKARKKAMDEWKELSETRKRLGFNALKLNQLTKAATDQRKRERRAIGGVVSDRGNRNYLKGQVGR